jgi:hypothetical protein
MCERVSITNLKLYGNRAVFFQDSNGNVGRRILNGDNLTNDRKKAYKGEITGKSIKKVRENIYAWMYSLEVGNNHYSKKGYHKNVKPTVITLTLSSKQEHDDKWIKKELLELFLKWLINSKNVVNYFWRAESQQNGNIHFHILIDKYVDKIEIQNKWNSIQLKKGYLNQFFEKYKHLNPPSTKIQIFTTDDKGIDYLIKYVTKENGYRKIEGLQVRFSNKLNQLKIPSVEIYAQDESQTYEYLKSKSVKEYESERYKVLFFDKPVNQLFKMIYKNSFLNQYYLNAFNFMYKFDAKPSDMRLLYLYFSNRIKFNYLMKEFEYRNLNVDILKNIVEW